MGDEKLEHKDPDTYTNDLKDALDEFEETLLWRYEADLDDLAFIWTIDGHKPTLEGASDVSEGTEQYGIAKKSAPGWAGEVREWVSTWIVDYGTQDLNKLERAFDDLGSAAELLGKGGDVGDFDDEGDKGDKGNKDTIPYLANKINGKCDWAAWAGASGEAFKENFGDSACPTMWNQEAIAASLANLYSGRACIIEAVRRNTINALKGAAKALRETEDSDKETEKWIYVGVVSIAIGLVIPPAAGAAISVAGMIGGYLDAENPDQKFSNDIEEIVNTLVDKLGQAGSDASFQEGDLFNKIIALQKDIADTKSKWLELYDFTGGEYSPAAPAGGFDVSVKVVDELSGFCFEASREYENVIAKVVSTDDADGELRGEGHVETDADVKLIDTKDALVSFLKTTCARYYEAGDRLHDTARDYFDVETNNKDVLKGLEDGPDLNGDGGGKGGSVDKHVKKSDRDDIEDFPESLPGGVEYGAGGV